MAAAEVDGRDEGALGALAAALLSDGLRLLEAAHLNELDAALVVWAHERKAEEVGPRCLAAATRDNEPSHRLRPWAAG